MSTATLSETTTPSVGMGEIKVASGDASLMSVLGSCVGVAIHVPRVKLGLFAHVVLPNSGGRASTPGKFADTAIPHMVQVLRDRGLAPFGAVAKITGGANMFGSSGPLQIGEQNIAAVREALQAAGIPLVAEHLGGTKGRRINFCCATGQLDVSIGGDPTPATI